jgi:hypothetical protein
MPYFVDTSGDFLFVVVLPPGRGLPSRASVEINRETAEACDLRDHQRLSTEQLAALQAKSVAAFHACRPVERSLQGSSGEVQAAGTAAQRAAPIVGHSLPAPVPGRSSPVQGVHQSSTSRRANSVAGVVEGICWLFLVVSVVLGLVIAAQSRVSEFTGEREHPYVAAGISIAVVGAFEALVVIMFAAYIKARTESSPA